MPSAATAPISGAPRTCIAAMARAQSALLARLMATRSKGSLVWSQVKACFPSIQSVGRKVRDGFISLAGSVWIQVACEACKSAMLALAH